MNAKLQKARLAKMNWTAFRMMATSERNLIKRSILIAAYCRQYAAKLSFNDYHELCERVRWALLPNTAYAHRIYELAFNVELYR